MSKRPQPVRWTSTTLHNPVLYKIPASWISTLDCAPFSQTACFPHQPLIMDSARCHLPMDAQRFDLMQAPKMRVSSTTVARRHNIEGIMWPPTTTQLDQTVGGIWEDHDFVIVPIEPDLMPENSEPQSHSPSPTSTASSCWTSASSSIGGDTMMTTPACSFHTQVFDKDDFVITRTIIRPAPTSFVKGFFTLSSIHIPRRSPNVLLRPLGRVFSRLNCVGATAFRQDLHGGRTKAPHQALRRPVLHVIVTQTREQWEQDMAFKKAVQEIYPVSVSGRR